MGTFIIIVISLLALIFLMILVYKKMANIRGRVKDFYDAHNLSGSYIPIFFFLIGLVWCFAVMWLFPHIIPGLVLMGICFLFIIIKNRQNFWKVFLLQLLMLPVSLIGAIAGLLASNRKTKTTSSTNIITDKTTITTHSYIFPAQIVQDDWELELVYFYGGIYYYENYDGTRCIVEHKATLFFENLQYDIYPLYNIYTDRLPRWISWLYSKEERDAYYMRQVTAQANDIAYEQQGYAQEPKYEQPYGQEQVYEPKPMYEPEPVRRVPPPPPPLPVVASVRQPAPPPPPPPAPQFAPTTQQYASPPVAVAVCHSCGAPVSNKFCAQCGAQQR